MQKEYLQRIKFTKIRFLKILIEKIACYYLKNPVVSDFV